MGRNEQNYITFAYVLNNFEINIFFSINKILSKMQNLEIFLQFLSLQVENCPMLHHKKI
jgi:hypothetical protein